MRRAAAVMVRSGLSTRPAISQPRPTEATAMMPSATPDSMSSWSRVSLRSPAAACWTQSFICVTVGGVPSGGGLQAAVLMLVPAPVPAPPPPVTTVPLVPAVPPALLRSATVPGSCRATRKYVKPSRHAAEARTRPT